MKSNIVAYRKWASWIGLVALLAAGGTAGLWLWQSHGASMPLRLAVGLIVLMTVCGAIWFYRLRSDRRLFAALDAYAEKELDRAERRPSRIAGKSNHSFTRSSS